MAALPRIISIFVIFCAVADVVSGDCHITVPSEQKNVPRLGRWLGWHWVEIYPIDTRVNIYGTVYAKCAYGFRDGYGYEWLQKAKSISMRCADDTWFRVYAPNNENDAEYEYKNWFWSSEIFACAAPNLQLYQSSEAFDWCKTRGESYFLKIHLRNGRAYTLAYFCYNVENKKFHAIKYKSSPKNYTEEHEMFFPHWNNTNDNGVGLENFQRVLSHSSAREELKTALSQNIWLKLANYEYAQILQTGAYIKFFDEFSVALDILWWPNLLHGNWQRFNEALEQQAAKVEYTLTTGTSGIAEIPQRDLLTGKWALKKFRFGSINTTIPKYIWTLGIAEDRKDDFLIISYNSPFVDLKKKKDVIFCEDICDQYEWLKDARSTFSYSIIGLTFCCALEEAIGVLEGLPIGEDYIYPFNQTTSLNVADISATTYALADNSTDI